MTAGRRSPRPGPGGSEPRPRDRATLVGREDLTATLAIFRFLPAGGVPDFEPGQFAMLGLPAGGERTLWRAYSIASPPEEKRWIELYVRLAEDARPGPHFTPGLWELEPGEQLLWKPPRGRFAIADRHPDGSPDERRLVLIAGGTGLAPFISSVLHRRLVADPRPIVLCHGARNVAELGYRELLLELERESLEHRRDPWSLRYLPTVSRAWEPENARWTGHVGRVESLLAEPPGGGSPALEEALGERLDPLTCCAYVCGFNATVASALAALAPYGFRTRSDPRPDGSYDVHFESYG